MRKVLLVLLIFNCQLSICRAQYAFYSMAYGGGINNDGVIFAYNPFTGKDSILFNFTGINGQNPMCSFIQANNGLLYGLTVYGGAYNDGVMFSYDPFNNIYTKLFDFNKGNGAQSIGGNSLIQSKNGLLYGTAFYGGTYDEGVIFSYNISTGKDSVIFNFDSIHGKGPCGTLLQDSTTGLLYGMTQFGGSSKNNGVLFSFDPALHQEKILFNFTDSNGHQPDGSMIKGTNGFLYGMGNGGKIRGNGIIFSYDIVNNTEKIVFNFNDTNGSSPIGNSLIQAKNGLLYGMTSYGGYTTTNDGVLFSFDPITDSEHVLLNFTGINGRIPISSLMQDTNTGLLYGMAGWGGKKDVGVIFSYNITTNKQTVLVDFDTANGSYTRSTLLLVRNTPVIVNEITDKNTPVIVFPNPSNGVFDITISNVAAKMQIEIYNMLGQSVYQNKLNPTNTQISLSNEPAGIYLYRVVSETVGCISSGKLIIQ